MLYVVCHGCHLHTFTTPRRWIIRGKVNTEAIEPGGPYECPPGECILMKVEDYMHCIRFHSCPCRCICTIHIIYIDYPKDAQKLYQPKERRGKQTITREMIRQMAEQLSMTTAFGDMQGTDTIRFYWKGPPCWSVGSDISDCCVNMHSYHTHMVRENCIPIIVVRVLYTPYHAVMC